MAPSDAPIAAEADQTHARRASARWPLPLGAAAALCLAATLVVSQLWALRGPGSGAVLLALDALTLLLLGAAARAARAASTRRRAAAAARERLLQTRAAELEALAGRVAHDLLNPLSSVSLALELLRRDEHAPVSVLDRADRGVQRAAEVVRGIHNYLNIQRVAEVGGVDLRRRPEGDAVAVDRVQLSDDVA